MKNKKTKVAIISVIALILVTIGITYAYWLVTKTQTDENEITAGCLDIAISGEKNDITLSNQFPMSDEDGMKLVPYEFTVTNNCNTSVDYQVALEVTGTEGNAIATSSLKVALNDTVTLLSNNAEVDATIDGAYESRVLSYSRLAASGNEGSSVTYSLRIWIDKDAPISEMNKTFKSKISVTVGQGIESPYEEGTLAYSILSNASGVNAISEIDQTALDHAVTATGDVYVSTSSNYYYGTEYTLDETTGLYTLSGTLTQAKTTECRNGTKTCGKYTLMNTSSTATSAKLYEVTDFRSSGNYVTANTMKYTNEFGIATTATDAGIYKTTDDLGDSYYFRGASTNNYVEFGNVDYTLYEDQYGNMFTTYDSCQFGQTYSCTEMEDGTAWDNNANPYESLAACEEAAAKFVCNEIKNSPMYWRIIRINGDGTIRLVYDGDNKVKNGKAHTTTIDQETYFSSGYGDKKYVGYTYDDGTGTQVDSDIKVVVDAWYDKNLEINYGKYIADSIFCNDRTETSYYYYDSNWDFTTDPLQAAATNINFGSNDRLSTYNKIPFPSLKCTNKSDRYTMDDTTNGNGLLTNPVGLLTADEVAFAGGVEGVSNKSYYLYSGENYSLLTPNNYDVMSGIRIFSVKNDGQLSYNSSAGARPVINLKANVEFTGDGTIDNPYKIVTE